VFQAIGDSMIEAGIVDGDLLFVIPTRELREAAKTSSRPPGLRSDAREGNWNLTPAAFACSVETSDILRSIRMRKLPIDRHRAGRLGGMKRDEA